MTDMPDTRPNPDELLAQVKAEERQAARGKLKVFFGACAGVGKTFTMLEAARRQKSDGADVVIGYVEPHARPETMALLEGLESLPVRRVDYRGVKLPEFDLDAALARKPALIIVDELAHTNVPGSRHVKRWQDVLELLEAGINVYTTLNVQHIETLNDVVAQLSGVRVRETVPDTIFDQADDVELVDLPPDELLQRLAEGKVYIPEQATAAMRRFFQKGNLVALRELALRRTAERINIEAEAYRHEGTPSPTAERLLVCVGPSPLSARLVRATARMAASLRAPWLAVAVVVPGMRRMRQEDKDRIWANLQLAERLGAEVLTITGESVVQDVLAYARATNVTKIIIGKPTHPRWRDLVGGSRVYEMIRQSGPIDVYVITGDEGAAPRRPGLPSQPAVPWRLYLMALLAVGLCTALGHLSTGPDLSTVVMIYLLGVIIIALHGCRGPALAASVLSASALNFFFIEPLYRFTLANSLYWLTVTGLALTGVIISTLVVRTRLQADAARQGELREATLFSVSHDLARTVTADQVVEAARQSLGRLFACDVLVLLPDVEGRLLAEAAITAAPLGSQDQAVAQWVLEHGQSAGLGTDTLPACPWLFTPLAAASGNALGVVGLRPLKAHPLPPDEEQLLTTLAGLIAGALERIRLADQVRRTQVQVEAEQVRSTLLSSVSHDLRTPLTSIIGAAGALAEGDEHMSPQARKELLQTITEEAERVNRLVGNLLEVSRLESGQTAVNREWLPVEELIGAATRRAATFLANRPVHVDLPGALPMLHADSVLMEQVLVNLLDNAAKYSPPDSPIDLSAAVEGQTVIVSVADRGPGVPPGERQRIFEKFVRLPQARGTTGAGLGLAICRAIVAAHGGRLWVEDRPGGGAVFRLALPLENEPRLPEESSAP